MLLLGSKSITVEGIQVFPDHADPNQFWYLPGPIALKRDPETNEAAFTFLKFRPAAVQGGARGGGFLMFTVDLQPDPHLENRILAKVAALAPGEAKLSAVEFDEGTVQCIAMNVQGPGGTTASGAIGSFMAVQTILGASAPALFGDNAAAFSLTLTQEGATLLESAFQDGMAPIGVIYSLKFTGMRPALDVKITADYKRVFNQFSAGLSANVYFVSASIEAGFEKLVQDGVIKIEVTNFTGEADLNQKEQWALDFFKQTLVAQWFEPTLQPGQFAGGGALGAGALDALTRGNAVRPPTPNPPPTGAAGGHAIPPVTGGVQPPPSGGVQPPPGHVGVAPPPPTSGTGRGVQPPPNPVRPVTTLSPGASPTLNTGAPPAPVVRPPAAGQGLQFNPASPTNRMTPLGNMGSSSTTPQVALKLKYINQEELKTVSFEYHLSEATQRMYAPQGFFGLLAGDLDMTNGGKHFREIDLDDPFFRVFTVTVQAPIDYARLGLTTAHVTLDYGDPQGDPQHLKHQDYLFDNTHKQDQQWQVFLDDKLDTSYTYSIEYHFDPESGWKAQRYDYQLPARTTENRTLFLNPFDDFAFLDVEVFPNRIDTGVVVATDVHLTYTSPGGWTQQDVLSVIAGKESQHWRLRLEDRTATNYSYSTVHHLKDGSTIQTDPVTTAASTLPVDDPFAGAIDLTCVPMLDPATIRYAFFDFEYDDPDNAYQRQLRLQFSGDAAVPVDQHVAIRDPKKLTFKYRLTFEGKNGSEQRGPFIETDDTLIAIMQGGQ